MKMQKESFGKLTNGTEVYKWTISNEQGMQISILDYGASIQSVIVPDRDGNLRDVVLGYDDAAGYEASTSSIGAFVGRYAGRICGASLTIDGVEYALPAKDRGNSLHGTNSKQMFEVTADEAAGSVICRRTSPHLQDGLPGKMEIEVIYTLTEDNGLCIDYRATSDQDTHLNLTNHSYFNLNGKGDVMGHEVWIDAERYLECRPDNIPTGRMLSVKGTPLDFTKPHLIGERFKEESAGMKECGGYDHAYVLDHSHESDAVTKADATVISQESGIRMDIYTTEPSIQMYTAQYLEEYGKGGVYYDKCFGVCFECQHFPDSPHQPDFPTTLLKAGETYRQTTEYRFSLA